MLLLLPSRFSRVRLCATPQTAAHQAPPSLGFSRQEHWSGLPLPSPMHESESQSEVAQSCVTLRDSVDRSPPGSSIHGIFQARVLEWAAIAFSNFEITSVSFSRKNIALSYVNELCICLEVCLSSRFMSIVLWPGMTHLVLMLSQNACCG